MKLALLAGNRFSPWHLHAFSMLRGNPEVTAFRAHSEIQQHFLERGAATLPFAIEPIYFDTQAGPLPRRARNIFLSRYAGREPRILPFHERLQHHDIIQSWELFTDWSAEALIARERWGVPLAVMVWDNIPFNMERNPERRAIKHRVAEGADRFIVHTDRSFRMLDLEHVPQECIVKIDPGVDTDKFSPGPANRAAFGLDQDDFVILFVGWFLPRKGIDFLLLALRELVRDPAQRHRRVRLMMVGAGPGQDRVEQLAARLGVRDACVFAGALPYDRMPEAFRAADLFILPSIATPEWQEQFGMSIIEAMAAGIPVISTYTGAITEIVKDTAILCQPNDFVALYEAVAELIHNEPRRRELAQQGREHALARFTLPRYAEALSDIYEDMRRKK